MGVTYYYQKNLQGDVIRIINSTGTAVVSYTYDAWGNIISTTGTLASTIGQINPIRYRSYYFDKESGLYYLNSRYYDSQVKRFVNGDSVVGVNDDMATFNLFAYCGNNPVARTDLSGMFWNYFIEFGKQLAENIQNLGPAYAAAGASTMVDGPLPVADVLAGLGMVVLTATAVGKAVDTVAKATPKTKPSRPKETVIYRYGGTNPGNLTPKEKDSITGLSFSTVPRTGCSVTTFEALNATGVVFAYKDGLHHVCVKPVGSSVGDWINAGTESIWTKAVQSVVVRWDGVG